MHIFLAGDVPGDDDICLDGEGAGDRALLLANTRGLWCGHPCLQAAGPVLGSTHAPQAYAEGFFFSPIQSLLTRFYLKHARLRSEQTSLCRSSRGHSAAAAGRARQKSKVRSKGPTPWAWGLSFKVISISLCLLINEMESKRREWLCLPVFLKGEPHVLLHLLETMVVGVNQVERQRVGQGAVPPPWRHP